MANQQLVDYIKSQLALSVTKLDLQKAIIAAGWTQADMDAVTAHIAAAYPTSNKGWGASIEKLQNDFLPPERIRNLCKRDKYHGRSRRTQTGLLSVTHHSNYASHSRVAVPATYA